MDTEELVNRFDYHPPKDDFTIGRHEQVRNSTKLIALRFNNILPEGREKSLAITHLEESMYWANAAIARENS